MARSLSSTGLIAAALGSWIGGAHAAPAKCPYREAHYALLGKPDVTARFVAHPKTPEISTDVYFHIRVESRAWDFWYTFDSGNGYSTVRLISIEDPAEKGWQPPNPDGRAGRPNADETYFGIDSNLTIRTEIPFADKPAPTYIFVPDFGMHVWYRASTANEARRYAVPRAFFKLVGCAR